jgi:hypothetical protein
MSLPAKACKDFLPSSAMAALHGSTATGLAIPIVRGMVIAAFMVKQAMIVCVFISAQSRRD